MKTHKVLDLFYTEEEGQDCFAGTHEECQEFVKKQGGSTCMYSIVPLTQKEIIEENKITRN